MNNGYSNLPLQSSTNSQSNSPGMEMSCPQKYFSRIWRSFICFLSDSLCVWFLPGTSVTNLKRDCLTPRALYVIRNNFYPICESLWTTLMSISLSRPNLFWHSSFLSFPYFSLFSSGRFLFASLGFYPSDPYIFAFK